MKHDENNVREGILGAWISVSQDHHKYHTAYSNLGNYSEHDIPPDHPIQALLHTQGHANPQFSSTISPNHQKHIPSPNSRLPTNYPPIRFPPYLEPLIKYPPTRPTTRPITKRILPRHPPLIPPSPTAKTTFSTLSTHPTIRRTIKIDDPRDLKFLSNGAPRDARATGERRAKQVAFHKARPLPNRGGICGVWDSLFGELRLDLGLCLRVTRHDTHVVVVG